MGDRKYYEAYDDRYRQVHEKKLRWTSDTPSTIVMESMDRFGISKDSAILELGCGEGRDSAPLLKLGYQVTATDISSEAIRFCIQTNPQFSDRFQILDCVAGHWDGKYDFIYAVAVVHMLVEDADRRAFYQFFREHLKEKAIGLICTMGDGTVERKSDVSTAFDLQERSHGETGEKLWLAGTSCRMVNWETFLRELKECGLVILEQGLTSVDREFPVMMYAVVKKS